MNEFTKTILGVDTLTKQQLDSIALNGGVIGSIGYGYSTRGEPPRNRYGYGFRWVNTQGMGNYGTLILVARSKRAYEFLRQGKVTYVMRNHNINYVKASCMVDAAKVAGVTINDNIIKYLLKTSSYTTAWKYFPSTISGVKKWLKEWDMPTEAGLTSKYLTSCSKIILALTTFPAWEG